MSGLLPIVKEHDLSVRTRLVTVLSSGSHLAAHALGILLVWRQLTLIQLVFNVYVTCNGFYYVMDTFSWIIRFQDGRSLLLSLSGWTRGCNVMWVTDIDTAKRVLLHSADKGSFLEQRLFAPAWAPVLSLESVNGHEWRELKSKFTLLQKHLPPVDKFTTAVRAVLSAHDPNLEIDAKEVARITVACFVKYIFKVDWNPEWNFVPEASWEWRKEIAARGKADPKIKHRSIEWLIGLINQSEYQPLFGDEWSTPECYSIIMQPFILSPMINVSDIAVSAYRHPTLSIHELIHYYHPFPIMERYVETDIVTLDDRVLVQGNTQVFIPLDTIGQREQYSPQLWTPFGIGPRKCQGTQYALPLLTELFSHYRMNPKFVPEKNHKYSGRNNDCLSFRESMYQLVLFSRLVLRH